MIDTPGHDSFNKFRASGVNLCDIALLIIDITKGIQKTTIESIKLLYESQTPFIIVLNKIDKINGWQSDADECFSNNLKKQTEIVQNEYRNHINNIISQFPTNNWSICGACDKYIINNLDELIERYCNHRPYVSKIPNCRKCTYYCPEQTDKPHYQWDKIRTYCNKCKIKKEKVDEFEKIYKCTVCEKRTVDDMRKSITMVPISAITGEGLPDLLGVMYTVCEKYMHKKLTITDELYGLIIEKNVKLKGFGHGYQVIVINGELNSKDNIYVDTVQGVNKYAIKHTFCNSKQTSIIGCRTGEIIFDNPINDYIYPGSIIKNTKEETKVDELKLDIKFFKKKMYRPYYPHYNSYSAKLTDKDKKIKYQKDLEEYEYNIKTYRVWIHAPNIGGLHAIYNLLKNKGVKVSGYSCGISIKKKDIIKMGKLDIPIVANLGSSISTGMIKYIDEIGLEIITEPVIYSLIDIITRNIPKGYHLTHN